MKDNLEERLDAIYEGVLDYDAELVAQLVRAEIDAETDIKTVLDEALIAAMDEVGDKFAEGVLFVPEMLMAANAMKAGLNVLRPHLTQTDAQPAGKVVMGTVHRDVHDIGKNLVGMMLEGSGFEVIDLGVNVPPRTFADAALEHQPDIIGMSALLTTTMPNMAKTVSACRKAGFQGHIIAGGAPVTLEFSQQCGADGYADDASVAVSLVRRLVCAET